MSTADHWLWRLSAAQWLSAARHESRLAIQAATARRRCLTHVRRSAGMALNAVLVAIRERNEWPEDDIEAAWGRSYVDHLRRIGDGAPVPGSLQARADELRSCCRHVLETPLVPASNSALVTLSTTRPAEEPAASLAQLECLLKICDEAVRTPAAEQS